MIRLKFGRKTEFATMFKALVFALSSSMRSASVTSLTSSSTEPNIDFPFEGFLGGNVAMIER